VFLRPPRMLPQIRPQHPPQPSTSLFIDYLIIRSCITAILKVPFNKQQARLKMIYSLISSPLNNVYYPFYHGAKAPSGPKPPHYQGFPITLRHATLSKNPLDEWSARRRDLYLTTHNTHKRQTYTPLTRFKPTISVDERSQTHSLDSTATGTGGFITLVTKIAKIYRCTVTSVSCIRYQRSTSQTRNSITSSF